MLEFETAEGKVISDLLTDYAMAFLKEKEREEQRMASNYAAYPLDNLPIPPPVPGAPANGNGVRGNDHGSSGSLSDSVAMRRASKSGMRASFTHHLLGGHPSLGICCCYGFCGFTAQAMGHCVDIRMLFCGFMACLSYLYDLCLVFA